MKSVCLLLAIAFTMLSSSAKLLAQSTVPNFNQVDTITISSHGGWMLQILPDGSASLSYGSLPMDNAQMPKQTFSFQNVYNLLAPHLSANYPGEKAIAVALHVKDLAPGTPIHALYLDDRRIVRQIMAEARDKGVPLDQNRFKELVAKHPPVPDDAP
jgi:hypothetical protein